MDGQTVELPTDQERTAAFQAFERGEFEVLESYLKRALGWYLEASRDKFNREAFIAGFREHNGKDPEPFQIHGTKELVDSIRLPFRESAAKYANLLGKLMFIQFRHDEAFEYFSKTVELHPGIQRYASDLLMVEHAQKKWAQ